MTNKILDLCGQLFPPFPNTDNVGFVDRIPVKYFYAKNLLMFGKRLRLNEYLYPITLFYYYFHLALWLIFMQLYTLQN